MVEYITFVILVLLGGVQLLKRSFLNKYGAVIFISSVLVVSATLAFSSYLQYQLWLANGLTRYFLPPYQSPDYFLFYSFKNIFGSYVISLVVSLAVFFLVFRFSSSRRELFYSEESYLAAVSFFLVGHPGWFLYLILLLFGHLIFSIANWFFVHRPKTSFFYLWVPVALFVIIISKWLAAFSWWKLLII